MTEPLAVTHKASPARLATPSLHAISPQESADHLLKRLEWTVLRRLDGLLQGDYRTLLRGTGIDLADLREYQFHDDVRHMDWNVTARLQQPHVRVFTEDREMSAWFLVDQSRSMDFGSGIRRKRDVCNHFVAVLARLLTSHGNRVGTMMYSPGGTAVMPTRGGRPHVLHLLHTLQADRTPQVSSSPTRLQEFLESAGRLIKRRSTLFVVSDFISEAGWEKPLGLLAQRHEVTAVRLVDPMEMKLPDLGIFPMRDIETGEQVLVDTHDKGFRKRFTEIAARREAQLRQSLGRAGVDTLELSTEDDLVEALLRFTDLRKRRSRALHDGQAASHLSTWTTDPATSTAAPH